MHRILSLFLLALFSLGTASAHAADGPIRILFLGHESEHHNSGKYLPWLMEGMGRDGIWFDYFTKPDQCLNAKTLAAYDAVMLYANHDTISPEQFEALDTFVSSGKGFLPIHCASACFGKERRFIAMVGGRFAKHGTGVFKTQITNRQHPITQTLEEFESWDETYVHDQHNTDGRTVLMERVEGENREPWTWVRAHGKGRVFYTASGHDERTWKTPQFIQMLRNAIEWSVGDARRATWQAFLKSREPENREANPNVANYEKRPVAITFQKPMSVKGSMERTQVPADMRLELFASEPQIRKPIAFAWDDRGRCWVCETSDYPHDVKETGEGNDTIRICEDTDGDGRADKFTVFADKLNIPTGLVFAKGGVIVSQPPRFLFLQDTDGDDKADVRREMLTGWGIGDTHAQASNLHWGMDNWLWGAVGYSGFKATSDAVVVRPKREFAMGTYRFKADGSVVEFQHQFTNNTWAHSMNDAGDPFGGTANGAPIFFGGIPATAFPSGMNGFSAKKINLVPEVHTIFPNYRQVDVFGGYTSAAGSAFIYSGNLPPRMQGMAMVCEPTMKVVALMDVRRSGAGYQAHDGFNLLASSDEWMSPVFAEVGPDGAVWVADWQNFIIQHNPTPTIDRAGYNAKTGVGGAHENPLRDHERGRIYRVVWNEATKPAITSLRDAKPEALVAALRSDNAFWRIRAQQKLVEGTVKDAVPALKAAVLANDQHIGAVHALWALHGLGALDGETTKAALLSRDARLRRNAIRALGAHAEAQSLLFGSGTIADPDMTTRLAAWVKLSDFPTTPQIQTLVNRLGTDPMASKDEWLREAARLLMKKHDASGYKEGPNLLPNPSLETLAANGMPEGWKRRDYANKPGNESVEWSMETGKNVRSGKRSLRVKAKDACDTSFHADVTVKPHTLYKLSAAIRTQDVKGKASMNDHLGRKETDKVSGRTEWRDSEVTFDSGNATKASLNILFVGTGTAWFDDVKLCELVPAEPQAEANLIGDAKRGEEIFWKHPVAACVNCHVLAGKGSAVGPALDGIAARKDAKYLMESLIEPNARLAEGYTATPISPMPPMNLVLKPQELEDIQAFLQTLR